MLSRSHWFLAALVTLAPVAHADRAPRRTAANVGKPGTRAKPVPPRQLRTLAPRRFATASLNSASLAKRETALNRFLDRAFAHNRTQLREELLSLGIDAKATRVIDSTFARAERRMAEATDQELPNYSRFTADAMIEAASALLQTSSGQPPTRRQAVTWLRSAIARYQMGHSESDAATTAIGHTAVRLQNAIQLRYVARVAIFEAKLAVAHGNGAGDEGARRIRGEDFNTMAADGGSGGGRYLSLLHSYLGYEL